jgi:hypothetical protein
MAQCQLALHVIKIQLEDNLPPAKLVPDAREMPSLHHVVSLAWWPLITV